MTSPKQRAPFHHLNGSVGLRDTNQRTDVAKIETMLALAGALDINKADGPTGYMGHRLDKGIKTFQKDRGLNIDGRLDPQGPTVKALAQNLQDMGRNGDTILAHISPLEAQLLHNITDGGTINPVTGLPEFFFGEMFSGFGDSLSSFGDSFSSGMSSIGDSFSGGLSDFADSFSKGFDGFSDGLSNIGDDLSKGFDSFTGGLGDMFDSTMLDKASKPGDSLGDSLKNNLAAPMDKASKTSNGLSNTLNKSPSSPFMESVKKHAGFPTDERPGKHANEFDGLFTKPRAGRPIKGAPGMAGTSSATAQRRRQNISTFKKQSAERLNAKNPIDNRAHANEFAGITAANDKTAAPILSDEAISSNGRLAKSLNKTTDFSAIKGHIEPGLKKGDPKAIAETHDLINQMNKSAPGHGDKLAKELGLDTSKTNVVGGTGDDTVGVDLSKDAKTTTDDDQLFSNYRKGLAPREGRYADRPKSEDLGGPTNKGMSQDQLNNLRDREEWKHLPEKSRDLSDSQIDNIFRKEYFDRLQIGKLAKVPGLQKVAPKLAEQVFDSGIHHGIKDSGTWLQKSLDETLGTDLRRLDKEIEKLAYDGTVGSDTQKIVAQAVSEGKIKQVNNLFVKKRIEYMRTLPRKDFNSGWFPRARSFLMP